MHTKFSHKVMGKEVGAASVYAKPHTMSGKPVTLSSNLDGVKTSGIVVRGGKAQTKGKMARGPMA